MPVLANTNCGDRNVIRASFLPFARPDYVEGMVIGDDLDSLLSAMYLHQKFGWPVSGIYCQYTRLWHEDSPVVFREKLFAGKLFAVDLDIYHAAVPSLGHHIISLKHDDNLPGHSHSLNPNALRGFSIQEHFRRKYPLATIHFLLWLFEEKNLSPEAEMLVWLADSTFVNAQHYQENVEEWVTQFFNFPTFIQILPALQTPDFEQNLKEKILHPMDKNPLCRPSRSIYRSKNLGINGFQCQFEDPNHQNGALQSLLNLLSTLSGWQRLPLPTHFHGFLEGRRREMPVSGISLPFSDWLDREGVFSYAFTFKDRLNFTVM
ncbi:MAG: hypothetical protein OHK0019_31620 [Saprospiraceae bacterium]